MLRFNDYLDTWFKTSNKVINSDNLPFLNYDRDGGHLGINMKNKDFPKIAGFWE
jgi:hypothetical protein